MLTLKPFSFKYTRSNAGLSLVQPLHVTHNQIIWLVGNSGSGKSTFLHLLKGFYPEFLTGSFEGEKNAIFEHAAYLAQNPLSQIVHERVGEEFFFSMENAKWSTKKMHGALNWLHHFGLSHQEYFPTMHLSHGLAQRLLLSSMLAFEPEWIVLDEPTAFLNPNMRDEFYSVLTNLKGKIGMLLIDHHPHAAKLADICWHVSDDGFISEMTVEAWLHQQEKSVEFEIKTMSWPIPHIKGNMQLCAKQLTVGYPKKPLFTADFYLNSGECAVLVGDNGTGKSSFFNTLAGILKPLNGYFHLMIDNKLVKPASQMSYVFQHPDSHFFFDSIAEELHQLGYIEIEKILMHIGLPHRAHNSPHQLSEGQKRRLTLLYPCLQQRPLILLDEPTFGQDAINTVRVVQLIQQLKQAGYALIVITHDIAVQKAIATWIWQIENSQLSVQMA